MVSGVKRKLGALLLVVVSSALALLLVEGGLRLAVNPADFLHATLVEDPARGPVLSAKGDAWKAMAGDDAVANTRFVEQWRPKVDGVSNARHKGMLKVILGENLEHARLFDQAAAGRKDLIGTSLAINDHPGAVMANRWTGD